MPEMPLGGNHHHHQQQQQGSGHDQTIIIFGCLIFLHMGCLITRGQLGSRTRICQNHQKSPQSWLPGFGASRGQCSQERSSTTEVCHHFTVCSRGAAIITHLRKFFFLIMHVRFVKSHETTVSFPVFANFRWNDHIFPGL